MMRETGTIPAAPMPCPTRITISHSTLEARPQPSENTVKKASETTKMSRCPYRSARRPRDRNNTACTMLYAFRTQDISDTDAFRSCIIAGTAMLTTEASRMPRIRPVETAARTSHLWG